jgi:hypothetical protein
MRRGVLPCLLFVAAALTGCGSVDTLSPANLKIEIRADTNIYYPFDPFTGTLTLTNKSRRKISGEFATLGQYHVDFYSAESVLERSYFPGAKYQMVSYLELGAARVANRYLDARPLGYHRHSARRRIPGSCLD